jgi:hypothetical protein
LLTTLTVVEFLKFVACLPPNWRTFRDDCSKFVDELQKYPNDWVERTVSCMPCCQAILALFGQEDVWGCATGCGLRD